MALLGAGVVLDRLESLMPLRVSIQRTAANVPSSVVVPEAEVASGRALLSVYARQESLHDPEEGILVNRLETGRDWEVPVTVSYFERAELVYAGTAGLRIHGGSSRTGSPVQSFRLHFRREYGARQFMPGVLFGGRADPVSTLVVHNDLRLDRRENWWHLVNPLAYDVARQMGALTPETHPVRFFLNGEFQGVYVLTSFVRQPFMRARYGYERLVRADGEMKRALRRSVGAMQPLTMSAVDELLDLESLTRWFMSIIFCGTTDAFQGLVFRDESAPDGRWFWVNWDMDHSFMDLYRNVPPRAPWRQNTFRLTLGRANLESEVITRLLAEDPDYRRYLTQLFTVALNHQITPEFLSERYAYYHDVAMEYGVEHTSYLELVEGFLERRPGMIRIQLAEYANAGSSYEVVVEGDDDVTFEIDGYPASAGYVGHYFAGQEIRVSLIGDRGDSVAWQVNNRSVNSSELWHLVDADTIIRPVFTRD